MTTRLTKSDWIKHGLHTLTEHGFNALTVGAMATKLKVSRGSFYWHFRDIADFQSQLLQSWQDWTTERIIRELDSDEARQNRLRSLLRNTFTAGRELEKQSIRSLDRAVRAWAAENRDAAAMLASVDDRRISYIAELLAEAGVDRRKAYDRATFLYLAYLGQEIVMDPRHASIETSAIDEIGDLFES